MKKLLLIISICSLIPVCMLGQEYDKYLNTAIRLFEKGEYEKAQSSLIIYQKMTGQSNKELQKKITFCIENIQKAESAKINGQYDNAITCYKYVLSNNPKDPNISREINLLQNLLGKNQNSATQEKIYKIGDQIYKEIGDYRYDEFIICHLDNTHKHGWVMEISAGWRWPVRSSTPGGWRTPNKDEMLIIYNNRHILGLNGRYVTSTISKKICAYEYYYTLDFGTGEFKSTGIDKIRKTPYKHNPYTFICIKNF